jgi:hypothetical protein
MTPSRIGRMATMFPGVRPSISFASFPTASTLFVTLLIATYGGFAQHDATPFGVDKRVGGTEIDGEIVGTQSGEQGEGHSDTSVLLVLGRALLVEEDLEGKTSLLQKNKDKQNLIR